MSSALFTLTSEPNHPSAAQQTALGFPEPLAEKYRPRAIADFVGLEKPRKILAKFLARPMAQSAWLFVGPPGLGKTTMGLALASELPAELHHIPARACDLERVRDIAQRCHYVPWSGTRLHLVLVDEADQMTEAAQLAFLSLLDATAFPPSTCFVLHGQRYRSPAGPFSLPLPHLGIFQLRDRGRPDSLTGKGVEHGNRRARHYRRNAKLRAHR